MRDQDKKSWVEGEWRQIEHEPKLRTDDGSAAESHSVIVLDKAHQRFYDKLRTKVEDFLRKQVGGRFDKYILLAPDLFVLLARLMQDKRVNAKSKAIAGMAVAYFISPLDFLPEMLAGPLGFLDDIVLAAYAISKILQEIDRSILLAHWSGEADLLMTVQDLMKRAEELVDRRILGKLKGLLLRK